MTADTSLVTGVDFVPIPTQDFAASMTFYGETLGLSRTLHFPERGYAEFETGNLTLSIIEPAKMNREFHRSTNAIALNVADVPAAREQLTAAGVTFEGDTLDTSVCHMAFFTDPSGNALMLHHNYSRDPGD